MLISRFVSLIRKWRYAVPAVAVAGAAFFQSCSNNPYPDEKDSDESIYYGSFSNPPKDLDPQRTYSSFEITLLKHTYEALFDYDYMARPLKIIPQLATSVPTPVKKFDESGNLLSVTYNITLRKGVEFIDDECFENGKGREVTAEDFVFAFKRAADPKTNCPIADSFSHIKGFKAFRERVEKERALMVAEAQKANPDAEVYISSKALYDRCGNLEGIVVKDRYSFDIVLKNAYPQMIYWLSMRFISATAHEAVDYYNGSIETDSMEPKEFLHRPVGTGPYKIKWDEYNREAKIVLERNEKWWGLKDKSAAPGITSFPAVASSEADVEAECWSQDDAGRRLSAIDRIELYKESETLPQFSKFLQGFYDSSFIPAEKMEEMVGGGDHLSEDMKANGIRMVKDFRMDISYLAFNMEDEKVGAPVKFKDPKLEENREEELLKRRKLRQAMTLAIDYESFLEIFFKASAVNAQTIIPPGIPGYKEGFKNPFKKYDPELKEAKRLMTEAGYPNGIDPETGTHLTLNFAAHGTTSSSKLVNEYLNDSWKKLGINVILDSNDWNTYSRKLDEGNFHLAGGGWGADYPDPENFYFLFYGENSKKYSSTKPNVSRFENPKFDKLFKLMETMATGEKVTYTNFEGKEVSETRQQIIDQMQSILVNDAPCIPLNHTVQFIMYHSWFKNVKPHPQAEAEWEFYRVNKDERRLKRKEWNKPIIWPAFIILLGLIIFVVPAVITIQKERR